MDVLDEPAAWPLSARLLGSAVPVAAALAAVAQHDALSPPRSAAVFAAVAVMPWLIQLTGLRLPPLLFSAMVLGGVLGLLLEPSNEDLAPVLLVYHVAGRAAVDKRLRGVDVMIASVAVVVGPDVAGRFYGAPVWSLGIVLAWAGGFAFQAQNRLLEQTRMAEQTAVERAAVEERQRIAREVHDVVAHSLSVTMLQLTGARLALQRGDHAEAVAALRDAERLGRESLADIRRTIGLLGSESSGTASPMPTVVDLPDLVDGFRAAGLDVGLAMEGDVRGLGPATGLGVYRIAQESLANVAKHAPGVRATVRLEVDGGTAHLIVRNPVRQAGLADGDGNGLGVRGMHERAELLGGSVRAEPDRDGWVVEAKLPRAG